MATAARELRDPRHFSVGTVLLYVGLLIGALLTIMPIFYMFTRAFMPEAEQMVWPIRWLPAEPDNRKLPADFGRSDLTGLPLAAQQLRGGAIGHGAGAVCQFLTAYAYARLEFPGRDMLFFVLLTSLMVPGAVTLIPNFLMMRNLGWLDSHHGLIWPPARACSASSCCASTSRVSRRSWRRRRSSTAPGASGSTGRSVSRW